ncbi:MAG: GNAT family N-acetyltransferase [Promethearchaeota archaeon]|nr:MAG: GNAT family N-acetyltransferase [Candidatus Lokiarchaeota archaeon]
MSNLDNEYLIERFDFNLEDIYKYLEIVRTAFFHHKHDDGGTILFDEQTFGIMFGSPYQRRDLFVKATHKKTGQIVGFVGAIPRNLHYNGKVYKFGVPAWLSVHPEHQKKGLARAMGYKILEYGAEQGYDGAFVEFDLEDHGIDAWESIFREKHYEIHELMKMKQFIVRVFDVEKLSTAMKLAKMEKFALKFLQKIPKVNNARIRKGTPEDHERIFELLQDHMQRNELSVVREKNDFLWYLEQPGVLTVVHEDDSGIVDGFLIAWKFQLAGFGNIIDFGWMDGVHIHRLTTKDARDLCKFFSRVAYEAGWVGIQSPYLPYFDSKPFKKAKFIFYPKIMQITLLRYKPTPIPKKVKSFYFDWR